MKTNNHGSALVLVMAVLLVSTLIGLSLLKMSSADLGSRVTYSASESARSAVRSGLSAGVIKIGTRNPNSQKDILAKLSEYASAPAKADSAGWLVPWLCGGPNSWETVPNHPAEKYRTRITGFNKNTLEITLTCEAVGKGNSRAKASGVYFLKNLGPYTPRGNIPVNALQMDNGNFEFTCNSFTVNGNTSVKKNMKMHGDGNFNGLFRVDSFVNDNGTKEIEPLSFGNNTLFDSTAYFAGGITTDGSGHPTFQGNAGFDGPVMYNSNATFVFTDGSKIYFNRGARGQTSMTHNAFGAYIYASGTMNDYKSNDAGDQSGLGIFYNRHFGSPAAPQAAKFNIPAELGISSEPDPQIHLNISLIDTSKIYKKRSASIFSVSDKITSDTLNRWYAEAYAQNKLWKGFLVVRFTQTQYAYYPFANTGKVPFNQKLILLIEDDMVRLDNFYESDMNSGITVLYLKNYMTSENIFRDIANFRGFFYSPRSQQKVTFQSMCDFHLKGAAYFGRGANTHFLAGKKTITWDPAVIEEIAATGLFTDSTKTDTQGALVINGSRIVPEILSIRM